MIVLANADIVGPDGLLTGAALHIDGERISSIVAADASPPPGASIVDCAGCLIVPGFVDVHVHGVEGVDVLDGPDAVTEVAARLPKYGVTAFCPTSVACSPADLAVLFRGVDAARSARTGALVLGAHLESNFINPDFRGAQPLSCLRRPVPIAATPAAAARTGDDFDAADILAQIASARAQIATITLAPELEGGLDLVRRLVADGHRVSIGHTAATYEEARAAIDAGVRHATHLFNRMPSLLHRAPGAAGAVLESAHVAAEIICDGFHVHPAVVRLAIAAKGVDRIMAITDGTAGSGLAPGTRTHLGRAAIVVGTCTAELEDGTLAGSILTMDGAFRMLVRQVGLNTVQAAQLCSTTPAAELGLADAGAIAAGRRADLAVLDGDLRVTRTYVGGRLLFEREGARA